MDDTKPLSSGALLSHPKLTKYADAICAVAADMGVSAAMMASIFWEWLDYVSLPDADARDRPLGWAYPEHVMAMEDSFSCLAVYNYHKAR